MSLISWQDLNLKSHPEPDWIVDPYIVREGITLLWAGTSVGKSPLAINLAKCIGEGTPFFGLKTTQSRVLFIELDTPEMAAAPRIKKLEAAPNVWFLFSKPLSIPEVPADQKSMLFDAREEVEPELVIVNTLQKCHDMDGKDARTVKLVYSWFQYAFPNAALCFVHHMRKASTDPKARVISNEGFTGSNQWLADAQIGIHLEKYTGTKENLKLYHRKSQVSQQLKPMPLFLDTSEAGGGMLLKCPLYDELLLTKETLDAHPGVSGGQADALLKDTLNLSVSTCRKRRLTIEQGLFPGKGYLLRTPQEMAEEEEEDE